MTTQLEKTKAAYEKAQAKADMRRMKKAYEYFDKAFAELNMPFSLADNSALAGRISGANIAPMKELSSATGLPTLLDNPIVS